MTLFAPKTLAWKMYAIAFLQLALLMGVFMGVGRVAIGSPPDGEPRAGEPPSFAPGPHHHDHGGPPPEELTIYDANGNVIASSANPPLGIDDEGSHVTPIEVAGATGKLVTRAPGPPPSLRRHLPPELHRRYNIGPFETLCIGGLVILGLGAFLTARWIVRPVTELSRTAKAIGAGNLRARVGLSRQDELGELGRAFDEMGERIERLLLAEKELMANISHELRTPLARLRVALDIAGEADPETGRASMTDMGLDIEELETLVNDILTATRLEIARGSTGAARFDLHLTEMTSEAVCERAAAKFKAKHAQRPLHVEIARDAPIVLVDPILFRRVIDNLLENAHKYSPDADAPITLRASADGDNVVFEVEDRGMGMGEDDLPQLFTPFFRSDRSRARGTGGVGLGLTLAKRIVEAHAGTITVKSELGVGTTMRVSIPTRAPSSSIARTPTVASST